jgi:hypothetical protein
VLAEPSESTTANDGLFDREAYLKEEGFEDVEVVVSGRNTVKIDRKEVRNGRTKCIDESINFLSFYESIFTNQGLNINLSYLWTDLL